MNVLRRILNIQAWSIRTKLLMGIALVVFAPLGLVYFAGLSTMAESVIENYETNLGWATQAAANGIETTLVDTQNEILNISVEQGLSDQMKVFARQARDVRGPITGTLRNNTLRILNDQISRHPRIVALRMLTPRGFMMIVAGDTDTYPTLNETFQENRSPYLQIQTLPELDPEQPLLLDPYLDQYSDELILEVATPILDEEGLLGYLVYTLNPEVILSAPLAAAINTEGVLVSEYLYLLDEEGWLLTAFEDSPPLTRQLALRSTATGSAANPERESYLQNLGGTLVDVTGRHTTIQSQGWNVVAEIPLESLVEPVFTQLTRRVLPVVGLAVLAAIILLYVLNVQFLQPVVALTNTAGIFASGNLNAEITPTRRKDEIGQLNQAIGLMADNLRQSIVTLEQRVAERTRDLRTATTIAQHAAEQEDIQTLLDTTVDLIVDSFPNVYHAQVFLIDDIGEYAELVSSTGEPGRQLLNHGHRLAVGSVSVIGRVTELNETVIARDTATSRVHRTNEFLPSTQAEIALPLARQDRMLGALDVQSKLAHAFTEEEREVFEILAAELAIIIDNARQFARMNDLLAELETLSRSLTRADWSQMLTTNRRQGFMEAHTGSAAPSQKWSQWQQEAAFTREIAVSPPDEEGCVALAVPILSRDEEVLGVVEWQVDRTRVNEQTRRLAEQLARRLANSMETIRLLERSQLLAERERLVNQISGKLTTEPSVEFILQTAVDELSTILQTSRVSIQLKPTSTVPANGPSENA